MNLCPGLYWAGAKICSKLVYSKVRIGQNTILKDYFFLTFKVIERLSRTDENSGNIIITEKNAVPTRAEVKF